MDSPFLNAGFLFLLVVLFLLAWTYNRLIRIRNRVQNAWSDVDVQLKRRHDLVPNLVDTVRGYAAHEQQTLEAVTRARTLAMVSWPNVPVRAVAEMELTHAVGNLFAVAERYPTLRAAQNFTLLQEQLTSTENRIAFARQFYNESVLQYNTAIATFPRNLIARVMGFKRGTLFLSEAGDRPNIAVKVNS